MADERYAGLSVLPEMGAEFVSAERAMSMKGRAALGFLTRHFKQSGQVQKCPVFPTAGADYGWWEFHYSSSIQLIAASSRPGKSTVRRII